MSYIYDNEISNNYLNIFSKVHNKYPDLIKIINEGTNILDEINKLYPNNETIIEDSDIVPNETEQLNNEIQTVESQESQENSSNVESNELSTETAIHTNNNIINEDDINKKLSELKTNLKNLEFRLKLFKNLDKVKSILDDETLSRSERYYQKQLNYLRSDYSKFVNMLRNNQDFKDLDWKKYPYNEVLYNNPSYKYLIDRLESIKLVKQLYLLQKNFN